MFLSLPVEIVIEDEKGIKPFLVVTMQCTSLWFYFTSGICLLLIPVIVSCSPLPIIHLWYLSIVDPIGELFTAGKQMLLSDTMDIQWGLYKRGQNETGFGSSEVV